MSVRNEIKLESFQGFKIFFFTKKKKNNNIIENVQVFNKEMKLNLKLKNKIYFLENLR